MIKEGEEQANQKQNHNQAPLDLNQNQNRGLLQEIGRNKEDEVRIEYNDKVVRTKRYFQHSSNILKFRIRTSIRNQCQEQILVLIQVLNQNPHLNSKQNPCPKLVHNQDQNEYLNQNKMLN